MADFLSALVHEARTPLTALQGALNLLKSDGTASPESVQEFADLALRNAARLVVLLDDLAVYARIRNPEAGLSAETIPDLSAVLERAAERVQSVAEGRGVTVEAQMVPFGVTADEALLAEAVSRMAFYAVRVTPRDGLVTIGAEVAGGHAVIRVADQGRPVPETMLDRVFEPFSPAARRGVDAAARAGLDLAIARIVAERHDGTLEFRQISGGGVMRLTLGSAYAPVRD